MRARQDEIRTEARKQVELFTSLAYLKVIQCKVTAEAENEAKLAKVWPHNRFTMPSKEALKYKLNRHISYNETLNRLADCISDDRITRTELLDMVTEAARQHNESGKGKPLTKREIKLAKKIFTQSATSDLQAFICCSEKP